jgi:hypothetical protein
MYPTPILLVAAALLALIVFAIWSIVRLAREWKAKIPATVWAEARRKPLLPPNERWRLSADQRDALRARQDRRTEASTAA